MLRFALIASFACALTVLVLLSAPSGAVVEIDVSADTYHIVDGDTFDAFPVGRIRLADIDAPESYEAGYAAATDALAAWVDGRQVFLDVDDDYVEDSYRRLVAVVYVRLDATHLVNVNEALMEDGYAVESDYSNQFDPALWTRVVDLSAEDLPPYYNDALDLVVGLRAALSTAQASAATSQALANAKTQELADSQQALTQARADLAVSQAAVVDLAARLAAAEAASGLTDEPYAAALQERDSAKTELNTTRETMKANEASYQANVGAAASSTTVAWVVAACAAAAGAAAFFVGRRTAR